MTPKSKTLQARIVSGSVVLLSGSGLTTFPWLCWPNMVGFNVLLRWRCNGLTGYGELYDFCELPALTALNGTPATRVSSAAVPAAR